MEKKLNYKTIETSQLCWEDYPDVIGGEITYAEWLDGTTLTDEELQALTDSAEGYDIMYERIF